MMLIQARDATRALPCGVTALVRKKNFVRYAKKKKYAHHEDMELHTWRLISVSDRRHDSDCIGKMEPMKSENGKEHSALVPFSQTHFGLLTIPMHPSFPLEA